MPLAKSIATFNVHLRYVKSIDALHKRVDELKPARVMICVDQDAHLLYVREFQKRHPAVEVCVRVVDTVPDGQPRDGAWHTKPKASGDSREYLASPEDFLNRWGEFGKNGLILNVLNEPSGEEPPDVLDRLVRWTLRLLELATERSIRVGVLNFATGHPYVAWHEDEKRWEWDARFDPILTYLSEHPEQELWDHEYFPSAGQGRVGRILAMVNRCKRLGIEIPNVAITEFGWDNDPHSGDKRSGYQSRGINGADYALETCATIKNVYKPLIDAGKLKMVAIFSYGNSGGWDSFNVENDVNFNKVLAENAPRFAEPVPEESVERSAEADEVLVEIQLRVKKSQKPAFDLLIDLLQQIGSELAP